MSDDFYDFDLPMSADRQVEDWQWREEPYRCRAFRSAIEEAVGPIPHSEPLAEAFASCVEKLHAAAQAKIAAQLGLVDEPVPIVASDILPSS